MPNLHIIIGDSNTRKSSLLRCLTGIGSGNATRFMDVTETTGNVITVYCMLSALQENYKPLLPAEFVKYIKALRPVPTDIAITLRVSPTRSYPAFSAYLQTFSQAGWGVVNVALLGPSACAQQAAIACPNICAVTNSPLQPSNQTANQVRNAWGWV